MVTGYLEDDAFRQRLNEADRAVCAFPELKSASGSLSTLIAAGVPLVASDVPVLAEYNAIAPSAVPTFSPYTAEALADAVGRALAAPRAAMRNSRACANACRSRRY
jgi:glycosyltransferase involved in cell wall biosynthesis